MGGRARPLRLERTTWAQAAVAEFAVQRQAEQGPGLGRDILALQVMASLHANGEGRAVEGSRLSRGMSRLGQGRRKGEEGLAGVELGCWRGAARRLEGLGRGDAADACRPHEGKEAAISFGGELGPGIYQRRRTGRGGEDGEDGEGMSRTSRTAKIARMTRMARGCRGRRGLRRLQG